MFQNQTNPIQSALTDSKEIFSPVLLKLKRKWKRNRQKKRRNWNEKITINKRFCNIKIVISKKMKEKMKDEY